jgi:hypothetical protein
MQRIYRLIIIIGAIGTLYGCTTPNEQSSPPSPDGNEPTTEVVQPALSGKVTDSAGNPIAEAQIIVSQGSVPAPEKVVLTTSAGLYEWGLPAGTFTMTVNAIGYQPVSKEVTITTGQTVTLDFVLEP